MSQEQRFSVGRGLQGCLATWACMFAFMLSMVLVPKRVEAGRDEYFSGRLVEMVRVPGANCSSLASLALTIPMAILGGAIWQRTAGGVQSSATGQSKVVNKEDRSEKWRIRLVAKLRESTQN